MRRAVVIEINEIPLRVLEWFASSNPNSTIARLLATAAVGSTVISDDPPRGLYPSQSWATLSTGLPFAKHEVYWYGDPKPADFPLYWQAIAEYRSVGVFGALHSSPMGNFTEPGYRFFVPDVFSENADVIPTSLAPLQQFNLRMTKENGRAVASSTPALDYLDGVRALPGSGLRPNTFMRLAKLAGDVATGRASRERLRTAQFLLLADAFEAQLNAMHPDLAVFFTNHVAAAMHRYWPASFPHDWPEPPNGPEWISQFEDEIPAALRALDRFLERILTWCDTNDRALVLMSSMGQVGGGEVIKGGDRSLVAKDPLCFAAALGIDQSVRLRSSMVPHLTFEYGSVAQAKTEQQRLTQVKIENCELLIDRSGSAVTVTYLLDNAGDQITIDGEVFPVSAVGLQWVAVSEHRAGVHDPMGTLIVANSPGAVIGSATDVRQIAPALLAMLGVPSLPHHDQPSIRLA